MTTHAQRIEQTIEDNWGDTPVRILESLMKIRAALASARADRARLEAENERLKAALRAAYTAKHNHDLIPLIHGCQGCEADANLLRLADMIDTEKTS